MQGLPLLGQQVLIYALPILGQQTNAIANTLPQYGAIGAIALVCMYAVYKLFNNLVASHKSEMERSEAAHRAAAELAAAAHLAAIQRADNAYDREVARGDRLEVELRELNRLINDKLAGELVKATDAIREALEVTRDRRRQ